MLFAHIMFSYIYLVFPICIVISMYCYLYVLSPVCIVTCMYCYLLYCYLYVLLHVCNVTYCALWSCSLEDIEKCKEKDILEQMLADMASEFPSLNNVFVTERDIYLANSLKRSSRISLGPIGMLDFIDVYTTIVII